MRFKPGDRVRSLRHNTKGTLRWTSKSSQYLRVEYEDFTFGLYLEEELELDETEFQKFVREVLDAEKV